MSYECPTCGAEHGCLAGIGRPLEANPLAVVNSALREQLSGCMWSVTKGGTTICQPPKSYAVELTALRDEVARLKERRDFWQKQSEDRERWLKEREAELAAAEKDAERLRERLKETERDAREAVADAAAQAEHRERTGDPYGTY